MSTKTDLNSLTNGLESAQAPRGVKQLRDFGEAAAPGESVLREVLPSLPDSQVGESLGPSLTDIVLAMAPWKRRILGSAVAGALISGVVAFVLPPTYTATTVIMPPQQQQSSATALLGQLGAIGSLAERDLGLRNPTDVYIGILGSRIIADDLIERYELQSVYREKTLTNARKVLAARSSFSANKGFLITITVEDHDPRRAAALANAYVDELHKQNNRLALTDSAQRRLFFERQLELENKALADAETALKATQQRTGVLQVNAQMEAVIRSLAQLRAEIAGREVALASLQRAATSENPEVVRQQTELTAMRAQLAKLETRAGAGGSGDPIIPTSELPTAGLEYVRALREVKYHETLFELTAKQYEAARLDEAKEAPFIQVVDSAVVPEKKSWPPRALMIIAGTLCFAGLACLVAFTKARLAYPPSAEKFRLIKSALFHNAPGAIRNSHHL